ncbi:MAG: DUF1294 domain-containing protein [Planctomycetes bacterium]|nr:DUF1294 domain-containing protein [Planctomycetota bacterium]
MVLPLSAVAALILTTNLAAFAAQGLDKARARRGVWRIPESMLLALGLPLAAVGMLLGMRLFKHKTRKGGFIARAALVAAFNLAVAGAAGWAMQRGWIVLR